MAKMGISTIGSYRGAQIFEAVGLSSELTEKYFKGTVSRIEGLTIGQLEKEAKESYERGVELIELELPHFIVDGEYSWKKEGVNRLLTPEAIGKVQDAANRNDYKTYKEFAEIVNNQSENILTIRGMLKFKKGNAIPLEEVEPASEIMKRFVTGAMSYGSILKEAHEALAMAMNEIGSKSNSGEGGENPERFKDNRRSATKQVASGRFGVTTDYLVNADELQIKMAQGAKPGEGGQLSGYKVDSEIGATRNTTPGIELISPPPHHDIYSIGAEEFGFATMPLVILGCVMMRKCHTNMCPVGVATQSEELRKKFVGRYKNVITYFKFISEEAREIMAEMGVRKLDEIIGRTDLLEVNGDIGLAKAKNVDLSKILYRNFESESPDINMAKQDFKMDGILDRELVAEAAPTLERGEKTVISRKIENYNRSLGAMLSGEVARKFGGYVLEDDTITLNLEGIGGQSFGVFGAKGITYNLKGQSNDYIGKGLFGAKIIIKKPEKSRYEAQKNVIGGNAVLYGAIKGQLYLNGIAGERFCVRNSGAVAVAEGVGDHGCEYMTGGRAVILGETGKNFAAGMSGGVAYVYDENNTFELKLNKEMVQLFELTEEYAQDLKGHVENHYKYTESAIAEKILKDWDNEKMKFKMVIAPEYKRLLERGEAI